MKQTYRILGLICILFALSCDLDKDLDNPNEVGISTADPSLLMNGIQRDLASFYEKIAGDDRSQNTRGVDGLVRMRVMSGGPTYPTAYTPQDHDLAWRDAYQKVLVNIETMLPLAEAANLTTHVAAGKIIKAYVLITLVDVFGDVPASQALAGSEGNLNPVADPGADVYAMAISLLDEARVELAKEGASAGAPLARDIFYGPGGTAAQQTTQRAKWAAFANSLELKAQLNKTASADAGVVSNATTRITALLTADLVDTDAEEFTYKYGTAAVPATSRHPYYRDTYAPVVGAANGWIGNHFMKEVFNGLGVQDPRWRYYFYRQVGSLVKGNQISPAAITCINANGQFTGTPPHYAAANIVYCGFNPGFLGRDHGNADGRNPDAPVVTVPGVYPVGGRVDTNPTGAAGDPNYSVQTQLGQGGNGAGILPIHMSFHADFMKAEIALRIDGNAATAKTHMINGVNKSINRVRSFAASKGQTLPAGLEPEQVIYVATLGAAWDAASTISERLDITSKEYYKALWGNALEAYNLYRRTSSPRNLQPVRAIPGTEGPFWRSMVYPAVFVNLNANAPTNEGKATRRVFWDGNPEELK